MISPRFPALLWVALFFAGTGVVSGSRHPAELRVSAEEMESAARVLYRELDREMRGREAGPRERALVHAANSLRVDALQLAGAVRGGQSLPAMRVKVEEIQRDVRLVNSLQSGVDLSRAIESRSREAANAVSRFCAIYGRLSR